MLKNDIAKMQRALIHLMLDLATKNGYQEHYVPYIANADSLQSTGQLPKFEEDLFKLTNDMYLIPTAEVPLTNLYRDTIIDSSSLPIKLTSHTPCFRSEAGSYGRDTKGLIRQHQFEKIELFKISDPSSSMIELEGLLENAEEILGYDENYGEMEWVMYYSDQVDAGNTSVEGTVSISLKVGSAHS